MRTRGWYRTPGPPTTKLNAEIVTALRKAHRNGTPIAVLAEQVGVTPVACRRAVTGITWTDVAEPPASVRHQSVGSSTKLWTCNGQSLPLSVWARRAGVSPWVMMRRLHRWPQTEALTLQVQPCATAPLRTGQARTLRVCASRVGP